MLGVTQRSMKLYLSGAAPVPDALFLRLVDLLSDQGRIEGQRPPDGGPSSKRR